MVKKNGCLNNGYLYISNLIINEIPVILILVFLKFIFHYEITILLMFLYDCYSIILLENNE